MKQFIEKNFVVIVLVLTIFSFLKGCNDSRELSKIKNEIKDINTNSYKKDELKRELKISGLESEKRMIQSTDRKLMDVNRQTEIDNELKELYKK